MPPKTRFGQEDIINAAFEVVRSQGLDALSARNIAKRLNCSTQPIYSYMESMNNLYEIILQKAFAALAAFESQKVTGHPGIDRAIGNVLFAKKEIYLWRFLHDKRNYETSNPYFEKKIRGILAELKAADSTLSAKNQEKYFYMVWFFIHGLSNMVNNFPADNAKNKKVIFKNDEEVIKFVIDGVQSLSNGFKQLSKTTAK